MQTFQRDKEIYGETVRDRERHRETNRKIGRDRDILGENGET